MDEEISLVDAMPAWYKLHWFGQEVLRSFEWEKPHYLTLLWCLPLLWLARWLIRSFQTQGSWPSVILPKTPLRDWQQHLRHLTALLFWSAVACMLLALARPQKTSEVVEQWSEGIDIVLTVDISESMKIEDFRPNRLEAAKRVCTDFVTGRVEDRIGLVVFSGDAFSKSPLSTDYDLLSEHITEISFDMIESRGTAIGSALAVSINRMRESKSDSKVVILLSDGDNTAGNIEPRTAAQLAQAYGIKVYTIGIGKEGKVPFGKDFFGRTQYLDNTLDESTLRDIARIGKGKFYRASNNQALRNIFAEIDQLEKSEIQENRFKNTTDYYPVYLKWGILLLLLFLSTKATFLHNLLSD